MLQSAQWKNKGFLTKSRNSIVMNLSRYSGLDGFKEGGHVVDTRTSYRCINLSLDGVFSLKPSLRTWNERCYPHWWIGKDSPSLMCIKYILLMYIRRCPLWTPFHIFFDISSFTSLYHDKHKFQRISVCCRAMVEFQLSIMSSKISCEHSANSICQKLCALFTSVRAIIHI